MQGTHSRQLLLEFCMNVTAVMTMFKYIHTTHSEYTWQFVAAPVDDKVVGRVHNIITLSI